MPTSQPSCLRRPRGALAGPEFSIALRAGVGFDYRDAFVMSVFHFPCSGREIRNEGFAAGAFDAHALPPPAGNL